MITISIPKEDTKNFMLKLLKENIFDNFCVISVEIINFAKFNISYVLQNENEIKNYKNNCLLWKKLKPYILNIIKGNETPKSIKISFSLNKDDVIKIHNNGSSFNLNMIFSENIIFTTATSQKNFILDKSIDIAWEEYIINFFKKNNIYINIIK